MLSIKDNIENIKSRIRDQAIKLNKNPDDIKLVTVTKNVEAERIKQAIACGIDIIGENRVQEAEGKFESLSKEKVEWHLVGHLQTNKVKKALEIFDLIHSVDSLHLAEEISKRSVARGKITDVLIEVNTSFEPSKYGIKPEEISDFVKAASELQEIKIKGLMTIGVFSPDPDEVRPCFQELRRLFEKIKEKDFPNVEMRYLSMGMTSDFEIAIQEGSNMVRIGTAIFGPRE